MTDQLNFKSETNTIIVTLRLAKDTFKKYVIEKEKSSVSGDNCPITGFYSYMTSLFYIANTTTESNEEKNFYRCQKYYHTCFVVSQK